MTFWVHRPRTPRGPRQAKALRRTNPTPLRTVRLGLERLEDRTLLDGVTWSYAWTSVVRQNADSAAFVAFQNPQPGTAGGSADVAAADLVTVARSAAFVNEPYTLDLQLTDQDSGASTDLAFTGLLTGPVAPTSTSLTNTFTGQTTQTVNVGPNTYTVTLDAFTPPGPPGSRQFGVIEARVEVNAPQGPELAVEQPVVQADDGAVAVNSGTYADSTPGAAVTLTASAGTITQNEDGTWSWSQATPAGPARAEHVVISARDDQGGSASTDFWLNVNQVFTVTTTADSGPGSLRQAITDANASEDVTDSLGNVLPSAITFNLPADDPNHFYYRSGGGEEETPDGGLNLDDRTTTTAADDSQIADLNPDWAHSWWSIPIGPTALPEITHPVFLDGYSQPGAVANDQATGGLDTVLRVELDASGIEEQGSSSPGALTLDAGDSTVQGLAVNGFAGGNGIWVRSSGNHVQGDFIGTDVSGTLAPDGLPDYGAVAVGPSYGVHVDGGATTADGNVIGTDGDGVNDAAERDLISANNYGVLLRGPDASSTTVAGDLIGTDRTGTQPLGNWAGVATLGQSQDDVIGTADAGNVISANRVGVLFGAGGEGSAEQGGQVAGNRIGTDVTGAALGNLFAGVAVGFGTQATQIGGNTIAFNAGTGVAVLDFRGTPQGITIAGNSIHDNGLGDPANDIPAGGLGIDLGGNYPFPGPDGVTLNDTEGHDGPNRFQDFPVIASVSRTADQVTITGTLAGVPRHAYRLEFFANATPGAAAATGGGSYGEGQTFLGSWDVTTAADGSASFTAELAATVPVGQDILSATATDLVTGDTSEFSEDVAIPPVSSIPPAGAPNPPATPPGGGTTPAVPPAPGSPPAAAPAPPDGGATTPVVVAVTDVPVPAPPAPSAPPPAPPLLPPPPAFGAPTGLRAATPFLGRSDGATGSPVAGAAPVAGVAAPEPEGEVVENLVVPAATAADTSDRPLSLRLWEGQGQVLGASGAAGRTTAGAPHGAAESALGPFQLGGKALQLGSALVDADDGVALIQQLTGEVELPAVAAAPPARGLGHAEEQAVTDKDARPPDDAGEAGGDRPLAGVGWKSAYVGAVILSGGVAVLAWRWWLRRRRAVLTAKESSRGADRPHRPNAA